MIAWSELTAALDEFQLLPSDDVDLSRVIERAEQQRRLFRRQMGQHDGNRLRMLALQMRGQFIAACFM